MSASLGGVIVRQVAGPAVVVEAVFVVDTVVDTVGLHLNPSRNSNPGSKSYRRNSVSHFGSILTHVQ